MIHEPDLTGLKDLYVRFKIHGEVDIPQEMYEFFLV